jgi:hypothetical protein
LPRRGHALRHTWRTSRRIVSAKIVSLLGADPTHEGERSK